MNALGDRLAFEQYLGAIRDLVEPENVELVTQFARLFAAELIVSDLPHLLVEGVLQVGLVEPLKEWHSGLVRKCALKAEFLVAKWNVPRDCLHVPLADRHYLRSFEQAVADNAIRPRL